MTSAPQNLFGSDSRRVRKLPCAFLFAVATLSLICLAQTPTIPPVGARGVVRLRVRLKLGESTKGLSRKRFFLVKGTLEKNNTLMRTIEREPVTSRDCYYRSIGASEALIRWLKDSDCESVYCRGIEPQGLEGAQAVPEFQRAVATGETEFKSRDLARKWLTINLPENIRDGFYKMRQERLQSLLSQAETLSGAKVLSVMTDRNGTAYFTDLEPGAYLLSNILSTEIGDSSVSWNCAIQVKPGDLSSERPFLISNRQDKNVKCVGIEKPLPTCEPKSK
jgi:hypothetical protein